MASIRAVTDWDWQGAEKEYRRAIELNPNYATAHHWYAVQLLLQGKLDLAFVEIKKAQQLDPLSLGINKDLAIVHLYARDYDKAFEQCRKTLEIEPNFLVMSTYIAQIYELKEKFPEAIAELEKAHAAAPEDGEITYGLAQAYALGGKVEQAKKLAHALLQTSGQNLFLPKESAYLQSLLGEPDAAVLILQKAYENHNGSIAEIKMDPRLDGLRSDPRVTKILQDIGLGQ
jgi:tetratricopeptide (TPR) repeat protein